MRVVAIVDKQGTRWLSSWWFYEDFESKPVGQTIFLHGATTDWTRRYAALIGVRELLLFVASVGVDVNVVMVPQYVLDLLHNKYTLGDNISYALGRIPVRPNLTYAVARWFPVDLSRSWERVTLGEIPIGAPVGYLVRDVEKAPPAPIQRQLTLESSDWGYGEYGRLKDKDWS